MGNSYPAVRISRHAVEVPSRIVLPTRPQGMLVETRSVSGNRSFAGTDKEFWSLYEPSMDHV